MSDSTASILGNLTRDPDLRYTPSGQPVTTFGVAVNRRWRNRQTDDWEEATSFFDVKAWGTLAEHVGESLSRGDRVIVTGRLEQNTWENDQGERRSKVELVADAVGPDLRWATAQLTKLERPSPEDASGEGTEPF